MDTFLQDLRFALRMLLKKPGFLAVAVITLALGIGANTALFSVVNSVLLRPLNFKEPASLARIYEENQEHAFYRQSVSAPNFVDWRQHSELFDGMAAYTGGAANLTGRGEPERVTFAAVTADFFSVLKVEPIMGRYFTESECKPNGPNSVVLSYGFWQRYFGGDSEVLGQSIALDGNSYTVIGVMPPEAQIPETAQFWGPLRVDFSQTGRRSQFLQVVGRLKPNVAWGQAQSEMDSIGQRLAEQYPGPNSGWGVKVIPVTDVVVGSIRPALLLLLGAVGFVLLIACANVANLLLARGAARAKEMAIRSALGAARLRIIRQLLTESLILALAGGTMGLLLAIWATKALISLSAGIPRASEIAVDRRVMFFTLIISALSGVIFGLAPALQASKTDLNETLKEGGRSADAGRHGFRNILVISEIVFSFVLLIGAGLMMQSFRNIQKVDLGFNPERLLTMQLSMSRTKYGPPKNLDDYSQKLIERLRSLPGVELVAAVTQIPLAITGGGWSNSFTIDGRPPLPQGEFIATDNNRATPDYFKAMSIPLIRGRLFTERDAQGTPPVVVISETAAQRFWPDEDPIGQRVNIHDGGPGRREIVGIVKDVNSAGIGADIKPMMYTPYAQDPTRTLTLVIRSSSDPLALVSAAREEIRSIDNDQPIDNVMTMSEMASAAISQERFFMLLLGIFAGLALLLAMVGIYGVMSYSVTQRTHEVGIRMALGASRRDVIRLIVWQGARLTMIGVTIGLAGAFLVTRLMANLLFGVSARDPLTFALIAPLLTIVALAACYIPARRATKVDPIVALRYE